MTIHGPSVLVRKKLAEKYAVSANYYMDMVTSASIDVEVERRERIQGRARPVQPRLRLPARQDHVQPRATRTAKRTTTRPRRPSFGISQDLFGDLTTISMGFSRGADVVRRRDTITDQIDPTFKEPIDRWSYRVGVSQILTKRLISSLQLEVITDEGFLNNPYRSYRYRQSERRPPVRARDRDLSAHAHQQRGRLERALLPALSRGGRTAAIASSRTPGASRRARSKLGYTHPMGTVDASKSSFRYYTQGNADFYSDLFDRPNQQNFLARDKELSTFVSQALQRGRDVRLRCRAAGASSRRARSTSVTTASSSTTKTSATRASRCCRPSDPNFRPAGTEPLYTFGANVIQVFVSVWF